MQPPPADAPVGTDPALAHVFEPGGTLARTLPGFRFPSVKELGAALLEFASP